MLALRLSEGLGVMWTAREKIRVLAVVCGLAAIAVLLIGVSVEKSACEAKGGKRLRGTWAWEGFECYDARTLKGLP